MHIILNAAEMSSKYISYREVIKGKYTTYIKKSFVTSFDWGKARNQSIICNMFSQCKPKLYVNRIFLTTIYLIVSFILISSHFLKQLQSLCFYCDYGTIIINITISNVLHDYFSTYTDIYGFTRFTHTISINSFIW